MLHEKNHYQNYPNIRNVVHDHGTSMHRCRHICNQST